jgi:plastocyanin
VTEQRDEGWERRCATIQLASSLCNTRHAEEAVGLLRAEIEMGSDELDDAPRAFLALCLTDVLREPGKDRRDGGVLGGIGHPNGRTPMPRRLPLILGTAALAAAAAGPATAGAATTLTGTVGPGFTITLKGPHGAKVTSLAAGSYKIVVKDLSNIHNFHLKGPGVDQKTSVGSEGTTTWNVKVKKGTYTYVCDPHKEMMKGSFTVR